MQVAFSKERPTLVVPTVALAMDQQGRYVFVVTPDMKVERRSVKIGTIQGAITTIAEGLSESEKVIVSGLQRVRPGVSVTIDSSAKQAGANAPPSSSKAGTEARS